MALIHTCIGAPGTVNVNDPKLVVLVIPTLLVLTDDVDTPAGVQLTPKSVEYSQANDAMKYPPDPVIAVVSIVTAYPDRVYVLSADGILLSGVWLGSPSIQYILDPAAMVDEPGVVRLMLFVVTAAFHALAASVPLFVDRGVPGTTGEILANGVE